MRARRWWWEYWSCSPPACRCGPRSWTAAPGARPPAPTGPSGAPRLLEDPTPQSDVAVGLHQHDVSFAQHHAERQHLREVVGDLAWREIDHGEDEPVSELLLPVVPRELRAGGLHAQLAEVDPQPVGGLLGLGEVVHLEEVIVADLGRPLGHGVLG